MTKKELNELRLWFAMILLGMIVLGAIMLNTQRQATDLAGMAVSQYKQSVQSTMMQAEMLRELLDR